MRSPKNCNKSNFQISFLCSRSAWIFRKWSQNRTFSCFNFPFARWMLVFLGRIFALNFSFNVKTRIYSLFAGDFAWIEREQLAGGKLRSLHFIFFLFHDVKRRFRPLASNVNHIFVAVTPKMRSHLVRIARARDWIKKWGNKAKTTEIDRIFRCQSIRLTQTIFCLINESIGKMESNINNGINSGSPSAGARLIHQDENVNFQMAQEK